MPNTDQAAQHLAAASIGTIGSTSERMAALGRDFVLFDEEEFHRFAVQEGMARPSQFTCRLLTGDELVEIIGANQATRLIHARWHSPCLAVPVHPPAEHWLVRRIGRRAADRLCAAFRHDKGRSVTFALPQVWPPGRFYSDARRKAASMTANGLSVSVIAQALGVSKRTVEKWRQKDRAEAATRKAGRRGGSSPLQSKKDR